VPQVSSEGERQIGADERLSILSVGAGNGNNLQRLFRLGLTQLDFEIPELLAREREFVTRDFSFHRGLHSLLRESKFERKPGIRHEGRDFGNIFGGGSVVITPRAPGLPEFSGLPLSVLSPHERSSFGALEFVQDA
jgi:hypothetical protein